MWLSALWDCWLDWTVAFHAPAFAPLYREIRAYTLCGYPRLKALFDAVQYVDQHGIAGALVECGTARGGSAALLGLANQAPAAARALWAFDTFEGLPPPTQADPDYVVASRFTGQCRGELAEVQALFARWGLLSRTHFVPGLFAETVPLTATGPIAVLHLDGDWYESVRLCLVHLYQHVVPGGVVQVDDYGRWQGARRAVDEFLAGHGLTQHLERVDYIACRWVKPLDG